MAKTQEGDNQRQILIQSGLTSGQAAVYEVLVHNRSLPAREVAKLAGMPRTLGYKFLTELVTMGLVSKKEEMGAIAQFTAAHPLRLKDLTEKKLEEAQDAKNALSGILSRLVSDFNTVSGQPGVRILEGATGLAEMYEDILNERQQVLLIRSPFDRNTPEMETMIQKQIADRKALGIKTRAITPLTPPISDRIIARDAENLVERRIIPEERFAIPAQVTIYANKVALTAYEDTIMTTIIENTSIRNTFQILFEYIWQMSTPEHEKITTALSA